MPKAASTSSRWRSGRTARSPRNTSWESSSSPTHSAHRGTAKAPLTSTETGQRSSRLSEAQLPDGHRRGGQGGADAVRPADGGSSGAGPADPQRGGAGGRGLPGQGVPAVVAWGHDG